MQSYTSKWTIALCAFAIFTIASLASAQTVITFDAPGAVGGTYPAQIVDSGSITGFYFDAVNIPHGFLRYRDGSIIALDAPDVGGSTGTQALTMNNSGMIGGVTMMRTVGCTAF